MTWRVRIERLLSPGLSSCYRCGRPWKFPASRRVGVRTWQQLKRDRWWGLIGVEPHSTRYEDNRSCFPLCEGCWEALATADERLPYYLRLWESWGPGYASWDAIEAGVRAESEAVEQAA